MTKSRSGDRLVSSPVFIISTPRSGSTLLRKILNGHSRIHAPGELVLTEVGVKFRQFPTKYGMNTSSTEMAFAAVGLDIKELEYLLWDRVIHRELSRSGKDVFVHKAPRILLRWRRIAECWPDARYVFLTRHPWNVITSGDVNGFTFLTWNQTRDFYMRYFTLLLETMAELPGVTVRYEDLTADPAKTCQAICEHLGLDFEPRVLDYGAREESPGAAGGGDLSDNMLSGRIQSARPLPAREEIPWVLRPICASLGYSDGAARP